MEGLNPTPYSIDNPPIWPPPLYIFSPPPPPPPPPLLLKTFFLTIWPQ